jgi:hypothetical protein
MLNTHTTCNIWTLLCFRRVYWFQSTHFGNYCYGLLLVPFRKRLYRVNSSYQEMSVSPRKWKRFIWNKTQCSSSGRFLVTGGSNRFMARQGLHFLQLKNRKKRQTEIRASFSHKQTLPPSVFCPLVFADVWIAVNQTKYQCKTKLRGLSPHANYTDRHLLAKLVPTVAGRGIRQSTDVIASDFSAKYLFWAYPASYAMCTGAHFPGIKRSGTRCSTFSSN